MKKLLKHTSKIFFIIFLFIQQVNALTTTKTIGSGGDYTTLKSAFDAINAGTLTGTITLQIIGSTTETGNSKLNANGNGSANYSSLLIYPTGSGYSISGNLGSSLVDLNAASYVTIDGRVNQTGNTADLTLSNTGTANTSSSTLYFENGASSNTVKYCNIKGSNTGSIGAIIYFTFGGATGNNNNIVDHCNITNSGSRPTNAIYSQGVTGFENSGNTISNNNIFDFFSSTLSSNGIFINGFNSNWTITGNSIYETTTIVPTGAFAYSMIDISNTGNNNTISGNYLGGNAPLCSGTMQMNNSQQAFSFTGMNLNAGTTSNSVQNNMINGISISTANAVSASPGMFTGIYISGGAFNVGTTTGNIIGATSGTSNISITSSITQGTILGIAAISSSTVTIQNNTIASISTGGAANIGYVFEAIKIAPTGTNYTVSGNFIGSSTPNSISIGISGFTTASTTVAGIVNTASGIVNLNSNTIQNLSSFGSGSSIFYGIYSGANAASLNINNNIISSNTLAGLGVYNAIVNTSNVTGSININNNWFV